ncbi:hypothetical protein IAR55_005931 [Kwoniella newhampshirensis]|uniref:Cep57 centrosome microtubule-binding domain-containing protein n=1 Tax=Kwoniella newhampshirensis TaxID=1651941 RepID=A0AAW0YGQ6_9TREE
MPASPTPYLTPPPTLPPTRLPSVGPHFHPRIAAINSAWGQLPSFLSTSPSRHGDEAADGDNDDQHHRADKKRRLNKSGRAVDVVPAPNNDSFSQSDESSASPPRSTVPKVQPTKGGRGSGGLLAPIKPIGFAASREARREDGIESSAIPSPVVMGFDFKAVDEDQLKTVRDTISIKEQQQALIAARRRGVTGSTPNTPKEISFKGWTPKEQTESRGSAAPSSGGGVGRRREKTKDKVEKMSIVTSTADRDVVPASKSAPLNQGLASQQASPREPPSGSQTSIPPHILPPLQNYGHHQNGMTDPRAAPLSHTRTRNGEEHEFARQQGPYYNLSQHRSLARPYDGSGGHISGPHSARASISNASVSNERRNFTISSGSNNGNLHPSQANRFEAASPRIVSHHSGSPSSPRGRETFLAPFNQLYDLLSQTDSLRYTLQDLIHRYEGAYQSQLGAMSEFKSTASAAATLLSNLQQSADSLKEMVRYEVERSGNTEKREVEELRERVKRLEERLEK